MRLLSLHLCLLTIALTICSLANAKGLEELGQQSPAMPENQPESPPAPGATAEPTTPSGTPATPTAPVVPTPPQIVQPRSKVSQFIDDKLFLGTSFNRAVASGGEGSWNSAGTSDIIVGYKLPMDLKGLGLHGTARYSATDVSAEVDNLSYRGILQGYQVGALATYGLAKGISLIGSFELGYLVVYLNHVDDLESAKDAPDDDGVLVTLGSGADFEVLDKLAIGPRLSYGFGQFSVLQVGGGVTLTF